MARGSQQVKNIFKKKRKFVFSFTENRNGNLIFKLEQRSAGSPLLLSYFINPKGAVFYVWPHLTRVTMDVPFFGKLIDGLRVTFTDMASRGYCVFTLDAMDRKTCRPERAIYCP
jgi:hypothetical protein